MMFSSSRPVTSLLDATLRVIDRAPPPLLCLPSAAGLFVVGYALRADFDAWPVLLAIGAAFLGLVTALSPRAGWNGCGRLRAAARFGLLVPLAWLLMWLVIASGELPFIHHRDVLTPLFTFAALHLPLVVICVRDATGAAGASPASCLVPTAARCILWGVALGGVHGYLLHTGVIDALDRNGWRQTLSQGTDSHLAFGLLNGTASAVTLALLLPLIGMNASTAEVDRHARRLAGWFFRLTLCTAFCRLAAALLEREGTAGGASQAFWFWLAGAGLATAWAFRQCFLASRPSARRSSRLSRSPRAA